MSMKGVVQSPTFKVVSLALLGVAVMMAIALALAYTEGASVPKSTKEFSVIESPTTTVKSSAEPCNSTKMGACGTVLEYGTPNSTLQVEVSAENTDMVASAQVRLCYAKPYIVDRPWRAASNVIGKDKQCAAIACNNMLFDGDAATCTYNVGNLQGDGVYYFRALLVGENGQFISASEVKDGVDYFQINSYNGRTTPIIIAVIVMSCVAWAILIFGLVRERLKKD